MRIRILFIISLILLLAACTTAKLQTVSTYHFEKGNIEVGMDTNEVRSIAGPPETIDKSTFLRQKQRWYYQVSKTGRVMITFVEGRAVEIATWQ